MQKLTQKFIFSIVGIAGIMLLIPSIIFAQSFFGPTTTDATVQASAPSVTPNQALSADDFKNKVQALDQETKNRVAQQVSQQLPKQPTMVPSNTPTAPSDNESLNQNNPIPTAPPQPPVEMNTAQAPTEPPAAPKQAPSMSGQPTEPPPTLQPPPQRDVYTGFGTPGPQTTTPSSNSSGNNSAGWNIKY